MTLDLRAALALARRVLRWLYVAAQVAAYALALFYVERMRK